jgi:hypothetical protein
VTRVGSGSFSNFGSSIRGRELKEKARKLEARAKFLHKVFLKTGDSKSHNLYVKPIQEQAFRAIDAADKGDFSRAETALADGNKIADRADKATGRNCASLHEQASIDDEGGDGFNENQPRDDHGRWT